VGVALLAGAGVWPAGERRDPIAFSFLFGDFIAFLFSVLVQIAFVF
jgi:hypothetical protein